MSESQASSENTEETTREEQLRDRFRRLRTMAGLAGRKGAVGGIRATLPIVEGYARSLEPAEAGAEPPTIEPGGALELSEGERRVLRVAGTKLAYEVIELASITDPVTESTEPYVAEKDAESGVYPAPKLAHLLSVGRAAQRLWPSQDVNPTEQPTVTQVDPAVQTPEMATRTVMLTAVGPGQVSAVQGSVPPIDIRRAAMSNQLHYSQAGNPVGASSQVPYAMSGSASSTAGASYASRASGAHTGFTDRCQCGGSTAASTQMARYDDDGECAPLLCLSCETKWRLRNCLKVLLCDLLYCVSANTCEDGQFKEGVDMGDLLGDCVQTALCSLVQCIPDALCGPRPSEAIPPTCQIACDFAVEEGE